MSTGTPGTVVPAHGTGPGANRVLAMSTIDFTVMFAVWLMFGILGVPIQKEFGLSDEQLAWISAVAVLNGSMWRLPACAACPRVCLARRLGCGRPAATG